MPLDQAVYKPPAHVDAAVIRDIADWVNRGNSKVLIGLWGGQHKLLSTPQFHQDIASLPTIMQNSALFFQ